MKNKLTILLIMLFLYGCEEKECTDWYEYEYEYITSVDGSSTIAVPRYRCRSYE